jgi:hypothetical protein
LHPAAVSNDLSAMNADIPFLALAASFAVLWLPAAGYSQEDQAPIMAVDIGLVGLAVDIEDGKRLGERCRWRAHPDPDPDECVISYSTLEDAGFNVTRESTISLAAGDFGPERYRMAGTLTALHFLPRERRARTIVERPGEVIVDTDGRVIGRMPATREEVWIGRDAPARVSATIEWSLFDADAGKLVASKKVKGEALELGDALYASMDDFVDGVTE